MKYFCVVLMYCDGFECYLFHTTIHCADGYDINMKEGEISFCFSKEWGKGYVVISLGFIW